VTTVLRPVGWYLYRFGKEPTHESRVKGKKGA